jgi:hypothetical protein
MTTISPLYLIVLCLLIGTATWLWRPSLFAVWIISFMVFPTARMKLGSAPVYLYDLMMAGVLGLLWLQGAFKAWPLRIIRWHGWRSCSACFMGPCVTDLPRKSCGFGVIHVCHGWALPLASLF